MVIFENLDSIIVAACIMSFLFLCGAVFCHGDMVNDVVLDKD